MTSLNEKNDGLCLLDVLNELGHERFLSLLSEHAPDVLERATNKHKKRKRNEDMLSESLSKCTTNQEFLTALIDHAFLQSEDALSVFSSKDIRYCFIREDKLTVRRNANRFDWTKDTEGWKFRKTKGDYYVAATSWNKDKVNYVEFDGFTCYPESGSFYPFIK